MQYDTALRAYTSKRVEEIQSADILVDIPCFNNETTIAHVIQMVSHGLAVHYKDMRSVIFVADGGSTDDTREVAKEFQLKPWKEKLVSIYQGPGGKGTALRSLFEAASRLGVKIHDAKDPGQHLGPMFRQVLSALFSQMERYESFWKRIEASEPVETFGFEGAMEPEPIKVNLEGLIELFKAGHSQFSPFWQSTFSQNCLGEIEKTARMDVSDFHLRTETWVEMLYELAATFHLWDVNRMKLLDVMTPLYYARVASFVRESWDMTSLEAENLVEDQAVKFEANKDYLLKVWDEKSAQKATQAG